MAENAKKTMLEHYIDQKTSAMTIMREKAPNLPQAWYFQELVYRIGVLETIQAYTKSAPFSADAKVLATHYQLFEAYLLSLISERKVTMATQKEVKEMQETALKNMNVIFTSDKARFAHYAPRTPEQYQTDIERFANTFLPAWVQYRNTLVEIKTKEMQS